MKAKIRAELERVAAKPRRPLRGMALKDQRLKNLTPYGPNNPPPYTPGPGRQPRFFNDEMIRRATQRITREDARRHKFPRWSIKMTFGEYLTRKAYEHASNGNSRVLTEVLDRVDGKVQQRVELVGSTDAPPIQIAAYRALSDADLDLLEQIALRSAIPVEQGEDGKQLEAGEKKD